MKIHLIKTQLANAIAVEYPRGLFVIDVARGCHRQVLGGVEDVTGRSIEDITLVTCTHDDVDHMGGIWRLSDLTGADIALPHASGSAAIKIANDPFGNLTRFGTGLLEMTRPRMWNMYANPGRAKAAGRLPKYQGEESGTLPADRLEPLRLKDGDTLPGFEEWEVLHTPGHSWDSCCYYHKESGSLVSGDTLLGSRKKSRLVLPAIYANRLHFTKTLNRLRTLDIRAVYPGHGMVIEGENLLADL